MVEPSSRWKKKRGRW